MSLCVFRGILNRVYIKGGWCLLPTCRVHTTDNMMTAKADNPPNENNIRQKILQASLPFVHRHGWSKNAISAGADTLGYPGVIHGMFPNGGADLVSYFYATCNQELKKQLKKVVEAAEENEKSSYKKPLALVHGAMEKRLRMIKPYLTTWPQAIALMTLPSNVPKAISNLLTLVDDICYHVGDRSVNCNWYTRRLVLAAIYKMTELHMVQDKSPDHTATWQFLKRRIEEAEQVHSMLLQSESGVRTAKEIASATFMAVSPTNKG